MPRSHRLRAVLFAASLLAGGLGAAWPVPGAAQASDELVIFGFFQNAFMRESGYETAYFRQTRRSSFSVQQLNLFFQKDLHDRWRAFVNFEFLNSFSSARRWGSGNLEEAWVRYRYDPRFSLKLGQSIPVFNNLNEIKNRTPILPYIVRPLVYETSFSEFIAVDEYLPERAFVQAYGYLPLTQRLKLDYAVFLGNGPNINDDADRGQTGVDTTDSYLVGGRLGLRLADGKLGLSLTRDHLDRPGTLSLAAGERLPLVQITRRRLGADASWQWRDWSLESEVILVDYDDDVPAVSFDKYFYYATLGYRASERLFLYASYWKVHEEDVVDLMARAEGFTGGVVQDLGVANTVVPTLGLAWQARDGISCKLQFAPVDGDWRLRNQSLQQSYEFNHISAAISVVF